MAFYAKRKLVNNLNALIKEADELLTKYPEVVFGNEYVTAMYQTDSVMLSQISWSAKVDNVLREAFGNKESDTERYFGKTFWTQAISRYANIRCTLVMKRDILIAFREEILKL